MIDPLPDTVPALLERSERECDCPEWIERCVHFNGRWITLHRHLIAGKWCACTGAEPQQIDRPLVHAQPYRNLRPSGANYQQALEAFHAAEERLLKGDEDA